MTLADNSTLSHASVRALTVAVAALVLLTGCEPAATTTPVSAEAVLPSWNDGPTRDALVSFVADVTTSGSPHYVGRN